MGTSETLALAEGYNFYQINKKGNNTSYNSCYLARWKRLNKLALELLDASSVAIGVVNFLIVEKPPDRAVIHNR